jgi:hypothetical protein
MELITYKKFNEQEQVEYLTGILKENEIGFEVAEDRDSLDTLYGANHLTKHFYIKIKKEDFAKVDSILLSLMETDLASVDKDHYLFNFTDVELFDILSKPDEWNEADYLLASKILKERGKEINDDTIKLLRAQRISELAKPDEGHRSWMYAGYIFALLGGLLGIFIGWHLSTFKKTLPNGQRVYGYTERDRTHGNRILIIGLFHFTNDTNFGLGLVETGSAGNPIFFNRLVERLV